VRVQDLSECSSSDAVSASRGWGAESGGGGEAGPGMVPGGNLAEFLRR